MKGIVHDMNKLCITNIQRMCFSDGPGLRTSIFLKGCNIQCPWCSNPENISFSVESYNIDGVNGTYGLFYDADSLYKELIKDKRFWGKEGGITLSGGEPLMQAFSLKDILNKMKENGVSVFAETALFVDEKKLKEVMPYIDKFFVDVKLLDRNACMNVLGGDIDLYKNNVSILYKANKIFRFRIPCCVEYTLQEENCDLVVDFLKQYKAIPVEIFKIHDLGEKKYQALGKKNNKFIDVPDELLDGFKAKLENVGISVSIIKI